MLAGDHTAKRAAATGDSAEGDATGGQQVRSLPESRGAEAQLRTQCGANGAHGEGTDACAGAHGAASGIGAGGRRAAGGWNARAATGVHEGNQLRLAPRLHAHAHGSSRRSRLSAAGGAGAPPSGASAKGSRRPDPSSHGAPAPSDAAPDRARGTKSALAGRRTASTRRRLGHDLRSVTTSLRLLRRCVPRAVLRDLEMGASLASGGLIEPSGAAPTGYRLVRAPGLGPYTGLPRVWRTHAVVAFIDLTGYTRLAEQLPQRARQAVMARQRAGASENAALGAEELMAILSRVFGRLIAIILAHGGDVVKFAGDALLVWWPLPAYRSPPPSTRIGSTLSRSGAAHMPGPPSAAGEAARRMYPLGGDDDASDMKERESESKVEGAGGGAVPSRSSDSTEEASPVGGDTTAGGGSHVAVVDASVDEQAPASSAVGTLTSMHGAHLAAAGRCGTASLQTQPSASNSSSTGGEGASGKAEGDESAEGELPFQWMIPDAAPGVPDRDATLPGPATDFPLRGASQGLERFARPPAARQSSGTVSSLGIGRQLSAADRAVHDGPHSLNTGTVWARSTSAQRGALSESDSSHGDDVAPGQGQGAGQSSPQGVRAGTGAGAGTHGSNATPSTSPSQSHSPPSAEDANGGGRPMATLVEQESRGSQWEGQSQRLSLLEGGPRGVDLLSLTRQETEGKGGGDLATYAPSSGTTSHSRFGHSPSSHDNSRGSRGSPGSQRREGAASGGEVADEARGTPLVARSVAGISASLCSVPQPSSKSLPDGAGLSDPSGDRHATLTTFAAHSQATPPQKWGASAGPYFSSSSSSSTTNLASETLNPGRGGRGRGMRGGGHAGLPASSSSSSGRRPSNTAPMSAVATASSGSGSGGVGGSGSGSGSGKFGRTNAAGVARSLPLHVEVEEQTDAGLGTGPSSRGDSFPMVRATGVSMLQQQGGVSGREQVAAPDLAGYRPSTASMLHSRPQGVAEGPVHVTPPRGTSGRGANGDFSSDSSGLETSWEHSRTDAAGTDTAPHPPAVEEGDEVEEEGGVIPAEESKSGDTEPLLTAGSTDPDTGTPTPDSGASGAETGPREAGQGGTAEAGAGAGADSGPDGPAWLTEQLPPPDASATAGAVLQAARTGVAAFQAMQRLGRRRDAPSLQVKVGIALGEVAAFLVGDADSRQEFFIAGSPVNDAGTGTGMCNGHGVVLDPCAADSVVGAGLGSPSLLPDGWVRLDPNEPHWEELARPLAGSFVPPTTAQAAPGPGGRAREGAWDPSAGERLRGERTPNGGSILPGSVMLASTAALPGGADPRLRQVKRHLGGTTAASAKGRSPDAQRLVARLTGFVPQAILSRVAAGQGEAPWEELESGSGGNSGRPQPARRRRRMARRKQEGVAWGGWLAEVRSLTVAFIMLPTLECRARDAPLAHAAMTAVVGEASAQGGTLRQFMVDDKGCVMILAFGLETPARTAPRAVRACVGAKNALRDLGLCACIGVASGTCFCGLVGSPARCEYTVSGDTVNLAARLMGAAHFLADVSDESVLVCERGTRELAAAAADFHFVSSVRMKGKTGSVDMYAPTHLRSQEEEERLEPSDALVPMPNSARTSAAAAPQVSPRQGLEWLSPEEAVGLEARKDRATEVGRSDRGCVPWLRAVLLSSSVRVSPLEGSGLEQDEASGSDAEHSVSSASVGLCSTPSTDPYPTSGREPALEDRFSLHERQRFDRYLEQFTHQELHLLKIAAVLCMFRNEVQFCLLDEVLPTPAIRPALPGLLAQLVQKGALRVKRRDGEPAASRSLASHSTPHSQPGSMLLQSPASGSTLHGSLLRSRMQALKGEEGTGGRDGPEGGGWSGPGSDISPSRRSGGGDAWGVARQCLVYEFKHPEAVDVLKGLSLSEQRESLHLSAAQWMEYSMAGRATTTDPSSLALTASHFAAAGRRRASLVKARYYMELAGARFVEGGRPSEGLEALRNALHLVGVIQQLPPAEKVGGSAVSATASSAPRVPPSYASSQDSLLAEHAPQRIFPHGGHHSGERGARTPGHSGSALRGGGSDTGSGTNTQGSFSPLDRSDGGARNWSGDYSPSPDSSTAHGPGGSGLLPATPVDRPPNPQAAARPLPPMLLADALVHSTDGGSLLVGPAHTPAADWPAPLPPLQVTGPVGAPAGAPQVETADARPGVAPLVVQAPDAGLQPLPPTASVIYSDVGTAHIHYLLGRCYEALGSTRRALAAFEQALVLFSAPPLQPDRVVQITPLLDASGRPRRFARRRLAGACFDQATAAPARAKASPWMQPLLALVCGWSAWAPRRPGARWRSDGAVQFFPSREDVARTVADVYDRILAHDDHEREVALARAALRRARLFPWRRARVRVASEAEEEQSMGHGSVP